jgi:hypothetical protein
MPGPLSLGIHLGAPPVPTFLKVLGDGTVLKLRPPIWSSQGSLQFGMPITLVRAGCVLESAITVTLNDQFRDPSRLRHAEHWPAASSEGHQFASCDRCWDALGLTGDMLTWLRSHVPGDYLDAAGQLMVTRIRSGQPLAFALQRTRGEIGVNIREGHGRTTLVLRCSVDELPQTASVREASPVQTA